MPFLKISTNVSKDKVPENLGRELVQLVAEMLGKPIEYVAFQLETDLMMTFGTSDAPCAQVLLQSIGKLGVEENKVYSQKLCTAIEAKLGIASNRLYIFFHDVNNYFLKYIQCRY